MTNIIVLACLAVLVISNLLTWLLLSAVWAAISRVDKAAADSVNLIAKTLLKHEARLNNEIQVQSTCNCPDENNFADEIVNVILSQMRDSGLGDK